MEGIAVRIFRIKIKRGDLWHIEIIF